MLLSIQLVFNYYTFLLLLLLLLRLLILLLFPYVVNPVLTENACRTFVFYYYTNDEQMAREDEDKDKDESELITSAHRCAICGVGVAEYYMLTPN